MTVDIDIHLFGLVRLEHDGQPVQFETRKALAMLAYLVVTEKPYARDSLALLFWPDNDQKDARGALRRTLSVLKNNLPTGFLSISRERIGIAPSAQFDCDVIEFRSLLKNANTHQHHEPGVCSACMEWLSRAVELYEGGFLSGFSLRDSPGFDEWQYFETERYRSDYAETLRKLIPIYIQKQEFDQAINYAQMWASIDPLREEAYQQLMLCYIWSGQRNAALLQYRKCVRLLSAELGVTPLEETTQLFNAILEGKFPPPPGSQTSNRDDPAQTDSVTPALSEEPGSTLLDQPGSFPLVGRSRETELILQLYHKKGSQGRFLVFLGEPGIGKTRLAEEFLSYVRQRGGRVISARCFSGESSLAYAPFTDALHTAQQLPQARERLASLPSTYQQQGIKLDPDFAKMVNLTGELSPAISTSETIFHEGIRQIFFSLLSGEMPGVLFLDDFHNADTASILQLSYMVHRLSGNPVMILIAVSNETLPDSLNLLINESQRSGSAILIKLARLLPGDLNEIVRSVFNPTGETNQQLALRIYQETEGLPFFVVEYYQALLTDRTLRDFDKQLTEAEWPIPGSVQTLLETRLNGLDDTTWQILTTAAIIGRSFEFQVLLDASGRSDNETLNGLERLLARRLIEEVTSEDVASSEGIFDFTHEKIREFVYAHTNLTRRRLLHRRVGDALARHQRRKNQLAAYSSQIAWHFRQAGQEQEAAEQYRAAGDYARSLFANAEAIQHYQAALALGHPQPAELHEAIGDLQMLLGAYKPAIGSFIAAESLADEHSQARLEHKLGCVYHRRGEWDLAIGYFQSAIERSEARIDQDEMARIYVDWSFTSYRVGRLEEAQYFARQAQRLAKELGSDELLAKSANILGILARASKDLPTAHEWFEASLAAARGKQDYPAEIAASNNLALILASEEKISVAVEVLRGALALCQRIGDRHHEAALLNHLAELFHANHQEELSMEYLKKAVLIFAEIGAAAEAPTGEIWMLSEW